MKGKKKLKKGDIILLLIGVIILISLFGTYLSSGSKHSKPNDSLIAIVMREGKQVAEIDLNKVQEPQYLKFEEGIAVTILAEKGSIRFLEADCPDKICIKTGILTKPGDQAICLPSKTIVKIQGD